MIHNDAHAEKCFRTILRFSRRINRMKDTLNDMENRSSTASYGLGDLEEIIKVEVNKDQIRGQLTREIADLESDLRAQAYELGEYFGV